MKKLSFLILVCLQFLAQTSTAQRIGAVGENWKTIKTEHFDILFSAQHQDLGLYYAQVAERAYQNLQTVFTEKPSRTVLVINDSTDASNGFATRIPYPLIMAYPVQINDHENLSDSGEWARELITHEMAHILQFEPALGFYKFIRPLFGTIVAPNMLLPLWWKEGMAVELETQFSPRGRLRSSYQDATLRAIYLDKKLFEYNLASINETLPSWPYGNRSYLFGSLFWSELAKDKGLNSINYITQRHGERIPYSIEVPMLELTNDVYEAQYEKALSSVEANAAGQVEKLKSITPTEETLLPLDGQTARQPIFSETHQLLAYIESKDGDPEIVIKNLDGTYYPELKNRPTGSIEHILFHPTEKKIYFTKLERVSSKETFTDLQVYDIDTDKTKRLTKSERIRDPRFSDDGTMIVFIATAAGKTQIKILNLEKLTSELVLDASFTERLYSPIFWNSTTLLFTKKSSEGQQGLFQLDLKSKTAQPVSLSYKNIGFLRKVGSYLYFTSNQNGVPNIYRSQDLKSAQPLSHTLTGYWSFTVSEKNNKIWSTVMTGNGFKIAEIPLKPVSQTLPVITNEIAERYSYKDHSAEVTLPEAEDYSPYGYLWPRYWIPYIAASNSEEGIYLQAQTTGQDPLQIHRYSILANYQTDIKKAGFVGTYTNSAFTVPFQLGSVQSNQSLGTVYDIVETQTNYLALVPDVFSLNKNLGLQLGVQTQKTQYLTSTTEHRGAFGLIQYSNFSQNIFQISPESGWGGSVRYENFQNVRSGIDFNRASASFLKYSNWLLPKNHAMMLRLNALMTFETVSNRFGSSNTTAFLLEDSLIPQFVLRGYLPHQFYGRSLWTTNLEYRFPISNIEMGFGSNPFFIKRISGAFTTDGLGVEGRAYVPQATSDTVRLNESYWSVGAEAKLETTVGYILPMNIIFGCYLPFSPKYSEGAQVNFGISLGGF